MSWYDFGDFEHTRFWYVPRISQSGGDATFPNVSTYMVTDTPGGWGALAKTRSRPLGASRSKAPLTFSWRVQFATENRGGSWRENNKLWVSLLDESGVTRYTLMFKPNREQDRHTSYDMELIRNEGGASQSTLSTAWSHLLTPTHEWVRFKMVLNPPVLNDGEGMIEVYYDAGGGFTKYIAVQDESYLAFSRMHFKYKTGTGDRN